MERRWTCSWWTLSGTVLCLTTWRGVTLTHNPLLVPWSRKSTAISLLPLWAVRPVQNFSACTRVYFTFFLPTKETPLSLTVHLQKSKLCRSCTLGRETYRRREGIRNSDTREHRPKKTRKLTRRKSYGDYVLDFLYVGFWEYIILDKIRCISKVERRVPFSLQGRPDDVGVL